MDTRGAVAQLHMCSMLRAGWALVFVVSFAAGVPVRQKVLSTPRWPASARLAHLQSLLDHHEALGAASGDGPTDEWDSPSHPSSSSETYATRSPSPGDFTPSTDPPFPTVIDTALDSSDDFSDELLTRLSSAFDGPSSLLNTFVFRPSPVVGGEAVASSPTPTTLPEDSEVVDVSVLSASWSDPDSSRRDDSDSPWSDLGSSWSNRLAMSEDLSDVYAIINAVSATHIYGGDAWTVSLQPSVPLDSESRNVETSQLPSIPSSVLDESYFDVVSTKWFYQVESNDISNTIVSKLSDISTVANSSYFLPWNSFMTSVHADISGVVKSSYDALESSISDFLLFNGSSTHFSYQSFFYSTVESVVTITENRDSPFTYILPTLTVSGTSSDKGTLIAEFKSDDELALISSRRAVESSLLINDSLNSIDPQQTRAKMYRSEDYIFDNLTDTGETDNEYETEEYTEGRIVGQFTFNSDKPFISPHEGKSAISSNIESSQSTSDSSIFSSVRASFPYKSIESFQSTEVLNNELLNTVKFESVGSATVPSNLIETTLDSDIHSLVKKDKPFDSISYSNTDFLDPFTHHVTVRSLRDELSIGEPKDSFQYATKSTLDRLSESSLDTFLSIPLSESIHMFYTTDPFNAVQIMPTYKAEISSSFHTSLTEIITASPKELSLTREFEETTITNHNSFELNVEPSLFEIKTSNEESDIDEIQSRHQDFIGTEYKTFLSTHSITPEYLEETISSSKEIDIFSQPFKVDSYSDLDDLEISRSYPMSTFVFGAYSSSFMENDLKGIITSTVYEGGSLGPMSSAYNAFDETGEVMESNASTFVGFADLRSKLVENHSGYQITPVFSVKNNSSIIVKPDLSHSISESKRKSYFEFQDSTKIKEYESPTDIDEFNSSIQSSFEVTNADLLTSNFTVLVTPIPSFYKTTIVSSNEMTTQVGSEYVYPPSSHITLKSTFNRIPGEIQLTTPLEGHLNSVYSNLPPDTLIFINSLVSTSSLMEASIVSHETKGSFQPIEALDMTILTGDFKTPDICMFSNGCSTSSERFFSIDKEPRSMNMDSAYDASFSKTPITYYGMKSVSDQQLKEHTSSEIFSSYYNPEFLSSPSHIDLPSFVTGDVSVMSVQPFLSLEDSDSIVYSSTPLYSIFFSSLSDLEFTDLITDPAYINPTSVQSSFERPVLKTDSEHQMEGHHSPSTLNLITPGVSGFSSITTLPQDISSVNPYDVETDSNVSDFSNTITPSLISLTLPHIDRPISQTPILSYSSFFGATESQFETPTTSLFSSKAIQSIHIETFIAPSVTNLAPFIDSEIQLSTYFKSKDPRSTDSESHMLNEPKTEESSALKSKEPKSVESDALKTKDPKSIESHVLKPKDPKSIESDTVLKPKDPKSIESDTVHKPKDPKSIESDTVLKPKDPKSIESDTVLKPKDPKSIESDTVLKPKDPKSIESDTVLKPKDSKSIESDTVLKPKDPKSIDSSSLKSKYPERLETDVLKPKELTSSNVPKPLFTSFSTPISITYTHFMSVKPQFEFSSTTSIRPDIKPTKTETTRLELPFPVSIRPELSPTWDGQGGEEEETVVASVLPISSFLNMNETKNTTKIGETITKTNGSSINQEQIVPTKNPLLFKDNHYWILTVLEAPLTRELPENFSHTMELRLANAYSEAFRLRAANNEDVKEAKSMVIVKILSLTDDILLRQLDLVYIVEKDGALVPANVASEYFSSLRFEQLREFLGHHVIIKARPYRPASEESRPVGSPLPVLAIVCGALGGLLLIFCCFCIYCRCCKSKNIPSSPASSTSGSLQRSLSKYGQHNRKHLFREMTHHLTSEMAAQKKSGSTAPDTYLAEKSSGGSLPTLPRGTETGEKSMKKLKILENKDASTSPITGKPSKVGNEGQESSTTSASEKKKAPKSKKRRKIKDSHEQTSRGAISDPICPATISSPESPPPTPPPKGDVSTLKKRRSSDSGTSSRNPESQPSSSSEKGTEETESEGSNVELLPPLKDMIDKSKSESAAAAAETEKHLSRVRQRISELLDDAFALAGGRRLYGSLRSKKIEPSMEIQPRFGSFRSKSAMAGQYSFTKHQGGIYLDRRPISEGGQRLLGVITDEGQLITHPSPKLVWEQDEMHHTLEIERPLSEIIEACNQNLSFVPFNPQRQLPSSTPDAEASPLGEAQLLPPSVRVHPAAVDQYDEIDVVSALRNGEPVEALIQAIKEELQKFSGNDASESHA